MKPRTHAFNKFLTENKRTRKDREIITQCLSELGIQDQTKTLPFAIHSYRDDRDWIIEEHEGYCFTEIDDQRYAGTLEELERKIFHQSRETYYMPTTENTILAFFIHLIADMEVTLSLDKPFSTYLNERGTLAFTPWQAKYLEVDLQNARKTCEELGLDIDELAEKAADHVANYKG